MSYEIMTGDCLVSLKTLKENSVDLVACDPPYVRRQNLEKGRGWNKGKGHTEICCFCGIKFPRPKSRVKPGNQYCCVEHRNAGQRRGDFKPRFGTGCEDKIKYLKLKYYKYRSRGETDFTVWEFVERIKNEKCFYCGDTEKLGLDRIYNTNPNHTLANTVVACELCNMTRGDRYTVEEFKQFGKVIKQIKECRNDN